MKTQQDQREKDRASNPEHPAHTGQQNPNR